MNAINQSIAAASKLALQQEKDKTALARQNKAKQSNGFNLDALGTPDEVSALAGRYDQIQVRNGQQSILFQRDTGAAGSSPVTTQSVVAADGQLKAVPSVGPLAQALTKQQTAFNQAVTSATPAWERYAVPVIGGLAIVFGGIFLLRKH